MLSSTLTAQNQMNVVEVLSTFFRPRLEDWLYKPKVMKEEIETPTENELAYRAFFEREVKMFLLKRGYPSIVADVDMYKIFVEFLRRFKGKKLTEKRFFILPHEKDKINIIIPR